LKMSLNGGSLVALRRSCFVICAAAIADPITDEGIASRRSLDDP
jgi:hypothetical protein